jgi:hypothetical protein
MNALSIKSVGAPPEMYADRIVAEMLRLIVRRKPALFMEIKALLKASPDGHPKAQEKLRHKLEMLGGNFFLACTLSPGKRGKYSIKIAHVDSFDPVVGLAAEEDRIPAKPQLACSLTAITSAGRRRYEIEQLLMLIVTRHALSRLIQRYNAKTADDLLAAANAILWAFAKKFYQYSGNKWATDGYRLQFEFGGGPAFAVLERDKDRDTIVATTII